jgi:uncharacterized protein (TIGR02118 family)
LAAWLFFDNAPSPAPKPGIRKYRSSDPVEFFILRHPARFLSIKQHTQGGKMKPGSVKRIGMVQRKKSMTREQFETHWLTVHAELCKKLPGMKRYSVNLVAAADIEKLGFDGFSELWFDSKEALDAALQSPEGKTLLADLPNFVEHIQPILVEEYPML